MLSATCPAPRARAGTYRPALEHVRLFWHVRLLFEKSDIRRRCGSKRCPTCPTCPGFFWEKSFLPFFWKSPSNCPPFLHFPFSQKKVGQVGQVGQPVAALGLQVSDFYKKFYKKSDKSDKSLRIEFTAQEFFGDPPHGGQSVNAHPPTSSRSG